MAEPAKRRVTYEDLSAVPEHRIAELIHGQLVTQPRPAVRHARAATRLTGQLGPFDADDGAGPGGWILLYEPELHLRDDVLVPDLSGWRRERMPELPDTAALEVAPDWVCEILSPGTAAVDRADKMPIYARERVRHLWLVDPILRTLEIFRLLDRGLYEVAGVAREDAVVRAEPFDAVELHLAALWAT